ncbi:Flocculation suppression protein [Rhodotorula kratochvilovae]
MTSNVPGNPLAAPSAAGGLPPAPRRSPRGSPELNAAPEHDEDDDHDGLEDEADDAASSKGRARSPEADAAPTAPMVDPIAFHRVMETSALQNLVSFFKHSNFASFLRQLNFYSWSKGAPAVLLLEPPPHSAHAPFPAVNDILGSNSSITKPDGTPVQAWEFRNPNFQRGRPDLLARIKRKTAKSNVAVLPALSRRRSSVTMLKSLRPSRRDAAFTAASDAGQSAEEERDGEGTTSSSQPSQPPAGPPSSSRQSVREESSAAPSKRVAAGLAEFAPYGGEPSSSVRWKEENDYAPSGCASPPYPRQPPPPPQPAAYALSHQYSPGNRAYGLPPTMSYSGYRYSYSEEPLARQVHAIEDQVCSLSDTLYYSQQDRRLRRPRQAQPDASPHYPYPNSFAYSFNPSSALMGVPSTSAPAAGRPGLSVKPALTPLRRLEEEVLAKIPALRTKEAVREVFAQFRASQASGARAALTKSQSNTTAPTATIPTPPAPSVAEHQLPTRPPTPDPAPPLAAPDLLAVFQTALKPIQTRLDALEARLPLQNRFSALPIEGDDVAPSNADDVAERSYADAAAFPALQHTLQHHQRARITPRAPPAERERVPITHAPTSVVLRNADNKTPQSLVSSLVLPSNTTTTRLPSGNVLLRLDDEKQAAHLRCTASSAGLNVATPVARHGALVHWVPKADGVEEELRAALEARGEGEEVVRELRWLGEGKGQVGSMMVILWNPERVSELVGGNGELWLGQQYRLSCERARGRKGRTHPGKGVLPPALTSAGGALGAQAAPQPAQEEVEQRAWRAREEGEKLNVEGEEAVQAATTTPAGAAAPGSAQEECKGPEGTPAARAASAQEAEREASEAEED